MTQITKKTLAVLLSLCLSISVTYPGMMAYAAEQATKIADLEAKITAFDSNSIKSAVLDEEIQTAYDSLLAEYTALSLAEKEEMNVFVFDRLFYSLVMAHEKEVAKAEGLAFAAQSQYATAKAIEVLSPFIC